jgi:hypothetical protein
MRTAPLIVLFILAMTVAPAGFRMPSAGFIMLGFEPWGFAANCVLFFPLGLALGGPGILQAAGRGAALSLAIELAQFFLEARHPEPSDLAANTLGALCGAAVGRLLGHRFGWRFDRLPLGRLAAFGAIVPLIVFGAVFHYRASLWMWDPSFKLAVGDELTRDRTWEGDIFEIAIFDVPLHPDFLRTLAAEGPGSISANRALFPAAPVLERTTPLNLENIRGVPLLEGNDSRRFFDSLVDTETFTIVVWCRPAKSRQARSARIITYSLDTGRRNFSLAQDGRRVEFRLRTWISGLNATVFAPRTAPVLSGNEDVLIAASYDGRFSRIYVDGILAQEQDIAEPSMFWIVWSVEFVPGTLVLLSALLVIAILGLARTRDRRLQWCVAGTTGGAAGILFLAAGGSDVHFLGPFVALFAPLGGFAVPWGAALNSDSDGSSRHAASCREDGLTS